MRRKNKLTEGGSLFQTLGYAPTVGARLPRPLSYLLCAYRTGWETQPLREIFMHHPQLTKVRLLSQLQQG